MDRILKATEATPSAAFMVDGVAADPGVVTVTITRENGTALVTAQPTGGTGTAARTYALSAVQSAALDVLTLDWTSASLGTITTTVEIVGGFLFAIADARRLKPLDSETKYPTLDLEVARTLAEVALEDACGVAFVPRYGRERIDGAANGDVLLQNPRPLSVTAASDTGLAVADLSTLELYRDGRVYNPIMWSQGRHNVHITYTHGYPFPPPRVGRACLLLAKRFLVDSPVNDRAMSVTNNEVTEYLVTAGVRDAVFDIPECNAVVQQYGLNYGVG